MIYEILHKYLDEDINDNDILLLDKTSQIIKENINLSENNQLVVLLDDIHINERRLDLSDLHSLLYSYFPNNDINFHYESKMKEFLDIFIEKLKPYIKKEHFKKHNKYVYYILIENKKNYLYEICIETNKIRAYCLFLSYIWCLFKIFNFNKIDFINYVSFNKINNKTLVNNLLIIEKKYSIIEDKVLDLVNLLNSDVVNFIDLKYI